MKKRVGYQGGIYIARRANYINRIDNKDETVLKAFYSCQHLSLGSITNIITLHRLSSYIKQGLVEKQLRMPKLITDKSREVFTLTDKGRKWINRNIHETRHMSPYQSSTAVEHNIKLSEVYLQSMRDGHTQWLTERDLQQLFFDTIRSRNDSQQLMDEFREHKISAPDGAIVRDGEICLVEVVTSSYTFAQTAAKESFSSCMSMPIEFYHA